MSCRYCIYFDSAKERHRIAEKAFKRKCIITNKDKSADDDICKDFLIISAVWCDKNDIRINLNSCLNRYKNKSEDCKGCRQVKEIIQLTKERG